jgi:hypothetical protein
MQQLSSLGGFQQSSALLQRTSPTPSAHGVCENAQSITSAGRRCTHIQGSGRVLVACPAREMGTATVCPEPRPPSFERSADPRPTLPPAARAAKVKAVLDEIFFPELNQLEAARKRASIRSHNKCCLTGLQRTIPDLWAARPASLPSVMGQEEGHVRSTSSKRRVFRTGECS